VSVACSVSDRYRRLYLFSLVCFCAEKSILQLNSQVVIRLQSSDIVVSPLSWWKCGNCRKSQCKTSNAAAQLAGKQCRLTVELQLHCAVLSSNTDHYPVPDRSGDGVLFSIDFFVCMYACMYLSVFLCFFVSKITRKRLDRFAWNFQGRCGVTMRRPDSIFGQFRETAWCRDAQHGDGVRCAFAPQLVLGYSFVIMKIRVCFLSFVYFPRFCFPCRNNDVLTK